MVVGEFSGDDIEDFVVGVFKGNFIYGYVIIFNGLDI